MSEARALLDSGDIAGLIRHLRFNADGMDLAELAGLMEGAAARSGFDDMREAAAAMVRARGPQELYDFGYACIERGVPFLAIPPLRRALELMPDEPVLLMELVSALERENRHAEAVAALEPRAAALDPWPARYLLAYNALLAGDVDRAGREAAALPAPDGADWAPAHDRLARMLGRARAVSPLDSEDLRGWHFALGGSVLATIETVPPDGRPAEELAAEIVQAVPEADEESGDGAPPDPDEALAGFARAVAAHWLTGPRDTVRSPGPVPSSRFA